MTKLPTKQILTNLVKTIESLHCENAALKTILTGCSDAHTRENWEGDLRDLLDDKEATQLSHALFEPIYELIDATNDEKAVVELLLKLPIIGKPS